MRANSDVYRIPLEKRILKKCMNGEFTDAKTIIGIMKNQGNEAKWQFILTTAQTTKPCKEATAAIINALEENYENHQACTT